jgi:hypothetical protein
MTTCYDFGGAIHLVKQGKRMKRLGWNGKDQFIVLATHISFTYTCDNNGETLDTVVVNPNREDTGNHAIAFFGTHGIQIGWLASQADVLAEDWVIAE